MKGLLFLGGKEIVIREFKTPEPSEGEVLIRMKAAGICGSDMQYLYNPTKEERAKARPDGGSCPEVIAGHEPCGVVESVGPNVSYLKPGDRVVVYQISGCGHCLYCLTGQRILCKSKCGLGFDINGAFADYMVTRESNCVILPDGLSFEVGAYCGCGGATAYSASKRLGISGLEAVAIFGLGPVGLAGVLIAKSMGAKVIGVDIIDARLELAIHAGADIVINSKSTDPVKGIMKFTGGEGADVSWDASGNPKAMVQTLEAAKVWGRSAFVGLGREVMIDASLHVIHKQLTLYGSWVFSIAELQQLLTDALRYSIPFENLITHRFSINEADAALKLFEKGETGKVVFAWP